MPTTCECEERKTAVRDGTMLYRPDRDGWMFTDIPIRRMSPMAAYFAGERGGENNTGEPYIYIVCPWCSEDLPRPTFDIVWNPNDQGDGGSDGPE